MVARDHNLEHDVGPIRIRESCLPRTWERNTETLLTINIRSAVNTQLKVKSVFMLHIVRGRRIPRKRSLEVASLADAMLSGMGYIEGYVDKICLKEEIILCITSSAVMIEEDNADAAYEANGIGDRSEQ